MRYVLLVLLSIQLLAGETFTVIHKKTAWSNGKGAIEITEAGIAFTAKKEKRSREWGWLDIQYFDRISETEFNILSYEDQKKYLMQQAAQSLKERGMPEDAIEAEVEKHEDAAREEAHQKVRVFFILDRIARDEKVFVTEGDVDVELRNIAATNNVPYEEARKYYEEQDLVADLRLSIMERKVRDFLRENAKITDK